VNVVSPGPISTPIFDRMGLPEDEARQIHDRILDTVPLKRFGQPEEIAAAVLFLSSNESSFVVGAELVVDGGMLEL
jgi:NAD(P)-dependent dehydrogenase (short-subunit alcohol dehydrogenase family)